MTSTLGGDPATHVALTTRLAWGDWFDPHSCTDRSWILLDRSSRRGYLYAFSHSD